MDNVIEWDWDHVDEDETWPICMDNFWIFHKTTEFENLPWAEWSAKIDIKPRFAGAYYKVMFNTVENKNIFLLRWS